MRDTGCGECVGGVTMRLSTVAREVAEQYTRLMVLALIEVGGGGCLRKELGNRRGLCRWGTYLGVGLGI